MKLETLSGGEKGGVEQIKAQDDSPDENHILLLGSTREKVTLFIPHLVVRFPVESLLFLFSSSWLDSDQHSPGETYYILFKGETFATPDPSSDCHQSQAPG